MATKKANITTIVPNFITCVGMTLGLAAGYLCFRHEFEHAAWLITICVLVDKLDGTFARLLNAGSDLGVELDSFSDFVTFCIAPAILVATVVTTGEGPLAGMPYALIAYASAIVYTVSGALRLARFNCLEQSGGGFKRVFEGIPTTMCGALLATLILVVLKYDLVAHIGAYLPFLLILCALAMNSRLYLPKLGKRKARWLNYFTAANLILIPFLIIFRQAPEYLLFLAAIYILVGLAVANRTGYELS